MPKIAEKWAGISGDQDSRTIRYLVTGAESDRDALDYVEHASPFFYDGMPRENITVQEVRKPSWKNTLFNAGWPPAEAIGAIPAQDDSVADGTYYCEAIYTRKSYERAAAFTDSGPAPATTSDTTAVGDVDRDSYSFSVSVESSHEIVPPFGDGGLVGSPIVGDRDDGNAWPAVYRHGLNYRGPEIGFEGATFLRPKGTFTLTWYPSNGKITRQKERDIVRACGRVNSTTWYGYEPGECLCTSVNGSGRNTADWQISATFAVEENVTDLALGNSVTIPSKRGWDFVDVEYVEEFRYPSLGFGEPGEKKIPMLVPKQATVRQVYWYIDFTPIFTF